MKQKSFSKKLVMVKNTVTNLNSDDMKDSKGGVYVSRKYCSDVVCPETIQYTNCYTCRPCYF